MAKATMEPIEALAANVAENGALMQLTLDQITLDPVTDVRSGPTAKDETARIEGLAKSMYMQGQLQPILVRPNGKDGHFLLIAGRRRFAAKKLMAELAAAGKHPELAENPITIDALVVNKDDDEAWVASIQENLQRRQFSPIELAQNILDIRKKKGWDGDDWTKHVAEFLHVSRATVSQHAKLLELPKDIRDKVHKGDLSAQSAFDLYSVEESKRSQVLARAEEIAEQEAVEDAKKPKSAKAKKAAAAAEPEAEKGKVKRKHVLEAARQADSLTTVKPRTRNEIVAFFSGILESTDPYPDSIVDFCKTFVNRWATGLAGDRALLNKLDAVAELVADKKPAKKTKAVA